MIYPSHYANASNHYTGNGEGQTVNGVLFTHPDLHPYEVMYNALLSVTRRTNDPNIHKAKIRPYLQGFTASYLPSGYYIKYGVEEVKAQIKAIADAGYEQWIIWDTMCRYPTEYFAPK